MLRADQDGPDRDWEIATSSGGDSRCAAGAQNLEETRSPARGRIVIIERNGFLRDCLHRSVAGQWPGEAAACGSLAELAEIPADRSSMVVILSIISLSEEEADSEFARLMALDPPVRSMVLARADDLNEANGYISMSAGFDIFIQAVRFVGAGGTYVPAQCLLAARQTPAAIPEQASASGITSRELAVIQAIRQGKPNKVIAYELNMCESTVKVHVRHIMKKLHAKNRTDVAIKGAEIAAASARADSGASPSLFSKGSPTTDRRSTTS
jgi:DNA-binding NarL/FixJ family response regulator